MGDTFTLDDLKELQVNYGLSVMNPRTYAGMKIVVSDNVPDGQAIVMGDTTVVSHRYYDTLRNAVANLGSTTAEATDAMQRMGKIMAGKIDDKMSEILAGTPIDPNPEQTAMERNPLWGAF